MKTEIKKFREEEGNKNITEKNFAIIDPLFNNIFDVYCKKENAVKMLKWRQKKNWSPSYYKIVPIYFLLNMEIISGTELETKTVILPKLTYGNDACFISDSFVCLVAREYYHKIGEEERAKIIKNSWDNNKNYFGSDHMVFTSTIPTLSEIRKIVERL